MPAGDDPSRVYGRRNRITRTDEFVVLVVALASALAGALAGEHPTAWHPADYLLTAAMAGVTAWAAASAPWWVLAVAAVPALGAGSPWFVLGAVAFVIALSIGVRMASLPVGRSLSAALTVQGLLRWEWDVFSGANALVAGLVVALIVTAGLARRRVHVGLWAKRVARAVLLAAGVAVVGAVIAGWQAASALRDGERALREAASALRRGDVDGAAAGLSEAEGLLDRASDAMSRPWARPAYAVPIVGQHVDALASLLDEARRFAATGSAAIGQIELDQLEVIGGVVNLDAVEFLEVPFLDTHAALRDMDVAIDDVRTPWLVSPFNDRLDRLDAEIEDLVDQTGRAVAAVRIAPEMLGRDRPQTYFVAFTTPAEARGLGGFMGSWAEIRAEEGRVEVVRTGVTRDLTSMLPDPRPALSGPADFLARYGRFGAGRDGAPVSVDYWSNITMSPDFPTVARVIGELYEGSTGTRIDGVIALDVGAIGGFLELVGPITVPGPDGPIRVDENNANDYLLRQQYLDITDEPAREAMLEELTDALLDEVFGGNLPGPRAIAEAIGPAMAGGRLVLWAESDDIEAGLDTAGITGALPDLDGHDGLAVVSNNAGANKLDAYLRRSINYEAVVDPSTGALRATLTVRLQNGAPSDLPAEVSGNRSGLPRGTNRMYLSIYTPWEYTAATISGVPVLMEHEVERGWEVYSGYVNIPPGGATEVRIEFAGALAPGEPYRLVVRSQALAMNDHVRAYVRTVDGQVLVDSAMQEIGVRTHGGALT